MQVSIQKSQVPNTKTSSIPFKQKQYYYHTIHTNHKNNVCGCFSLVFRPVGYSSNHSSLTDLSHRRSASGGSASTGIGSIMEPSDQQGESRTSPSVSAPERPSTPAKVHRYCFYYRLLTRFLCWF